jgi:FkbM family methyltransferase
VGTEGKEKKFQRVANKRKRATPMKVFVEIGVGLFGTCQQLLDNGWRGIMVEPLKEVCDQIPQHPNLSVECVAISTKTGTETLLKVNDHTIYDEPDVYLGMSGLKIGFNPLYDKGYEGTLTEIEVPTMTIEDIIKKYNLKEINLLKVDTEGMDIEILYNYSFNILPTMIKFEHAHGSGEVYDYSWVGLNQKEIGEKFQKLLSKLESLGYIVWKEKEDVYCVR